MAFPISTVFEGLKGLIHVTVTADANGQPELVHLADEAGHACAHFAVHEWDLLGQHIEAALYAELEKHDTPSPAVPLGGTITEPAVTPTAPFLPPEQPTDTTGQGASDPEAAATPPAGEDHQA